MKFTKMHGTGNDYIYVNTIDEKIKNPSSLAVKLSDRHFGIGSDGLILIDKSNKADFKMTMFNADGSEGKMCGNGIRCVGKFVFDKKLSNKKNLEIETISGIIKLELNILKEKVNSVKVDMGKPIFEGRKIPVKSQKSLVLNHEFHVEKEKFKINCVSMGNPHAVIFVDEITDYLVKEIGPKIEKDKFFPDKVNVEFVKVLSKNKIKMRVWERGSGETMACGTGACAASVISFLNGFTERKVIVELKGGILEIEYSAQENVFMTGSCETVFEGEIQI